MRHDVEHRRALLRKLDKLSDLLLRRVSGDVECDVDGPEAVAHLFVKAEEPAQIQIAVEFEFQRVDLDASRGGVIDDGCAES